MKQVIQSRRGGGLEIKEVPPPTLEPLHLLVRTRASLISAGTERSAVSFAQKSLASKARERPDLVKKVIDKFRRDGLRATLASVRARLDEPLPLGYSAAGEVIEVGVGLEGRFRVGDRVACAGAGVANHAEINLVPGALAAPVPAGVPFEEACFGTLGAIALNGVRLLAPQLGDTVAVIGAGLVGQLACGLLAAAGARVIAIEPDAARRTLALSLAAEAAFDPGDPVLDEAIAGLTGNIGIDGILIAAASQTAEPLDLAARIARDRARVVLVGMVGTGFSFRDYMKKELTILVSRSYGPGRYDRAFEERGVTYPEGHVRWTETANLCEVLRRMAPGARGRLNLKPLISHRFPIGDADKAYDLLESGGAGERPLGVVLTYAGAFGSAAAVERPSVTARAHAPRKAGECVFGLIGAGAFARAALLPALKTIPGVRLRLVATRRGAFAEETKRAFGFEQAATDIEAVISDPDINAVIIATRHSTHAQFAQRALAAGKSVLVEKPLALTRTDVKRVAEARNTSQGIFQVGFNRRFAPMAIELKNALVQAGGAPFILMRVNAGPLPRDHWLYDPEQGHGRILGELCHFVDFARFLVGRPIESVRADAARAGLSAEDVSVQMRFEGGGLVTLAYTALGDPAASKERIEGYAGGTVGVIDDFRSLSISRGGKVLSRTARQDKGIRAELAAFVEAIRTGGPAPIDESELIETSLASLAVVESLASGQAARP